MESFRHILSPSQHGRYTSSAGAPLVSGSEPSYEQVRKARRKIEAAPNAFRVLVRVVALVAAASIIGVLAHATVVWFTTRNVIQQETTGIRQRAWPNHIDGWPTWVMLATALFAVIVQVLSLLTFCGGIRKLRETRLHCWAVFFTSLLGITAWVAASVYFKWQDSQGKKSWDLWSWSCSHKSLKTGKMSFETICTEMKFTWYASIIVAFLELVSLATFAHVWYRSRKEGRGYSKITVSHI